MNRFGHIDLRVSDIGVALKFYSQLLPALGFTRHHGGKEWQVFAGDGELPSAPFVALTEEREHHPNSNRIAFWAGSREEVDRLAEVAKAAGARNVNGPKPCPEYSATYYAVFFEDPSGNRLEICFRRDRSRLRGISQSHRRQQRPGALARLRPLLYRRYPDAGRDRDRERVQLPPRGRDQIPIFFPLFCSSSQVLSGAK